jgi:hypothetical protein
MSIVVFNHLNPRYDPRPAAVIRKAPEFKTPELYVDPPTPVNHCTICILCGKQVAPCGCGLIAAHISEGTICVECTEEYSPTGQIGRD